MRRSAWTMCVLLAAASTACKKEQPAGDTAAQLPPPDTAMAADTAPAVAAAPAVTSPATSASRPRRQAPPSPVPVNRDVPYVSNDTGTVAPGMTQAQVEALWGRPVATRSTGQMLYLYYPNGCEWTCGTLDVVFLENGHVVDAVLRWPGHRYSGQSSSPAGTQPVATVPDRPTP